MNECLPNSHEKRCLAADDGYYVDLSGLVHGCMPVDNAASITCSSDNDSVTDACSQGYWLSVNQDECSLCQEQVGCITSAPSQGCVTATPEQNVAGGTYGASNLFCNIADDPLYEIYPQGSGIVVNSINKYMEDNCDAPSCFCCKNSNRFTEEQCEEQVASCERTCSGEEILEVPPPYPDANAALLTFLCTANDGSTIDSTNCSERYGLHPEGNYNATHTGNYYQCIWSEELSQCGFFFYDMDIPHLGPNYRECLTGSPPPPPAVDVTPPVPSAPDHDCVGYWGNWEGCSEECGTGESQRVYQVTTPKVGGGQNCVVADGTSETQGCNTRSCNDYCNAEASASGPFGGGHGGTVWQQCCARVGDRCE